MSNYEDWRNDLAASSREPRGFKGSRLQSESTWLLPVERKPCPWADTQNRQGERPKRKTDRENTHTRERAGLPWWNHDRYVRHVSDGQDRGRYWVNQKAAECVSWPTPGVVLETSRCCLIPAHQTWNISRYSVALPTCSGSSLCFSL